MYKYTFEDYTDDISIIHKKLKKLENVHIIAPYKGGLPLGTALANRLNSPLSIIKMQRYADTDREATLIYDAGVKSTEEIVLVDDLYDTGETLVQCARFIKDNYPENKFRVITLFGRESTLVQGIKYEYLREHPNDWITFEPWE